MGKPGAILLIGGGLFIMALGWSGKLSMVWDIMKGNVPGLPTLPGGDPAPPATVACENAGDCDQGEKCVAGVCRPESRAPGDGPGNCASGQTKVTVMTSAAVRCVLTADLSATENGNCRNGYVLVNRQDPDGSAVALCLRSVPSNGGGDVPNDYAYIIQPTGATVARYQPNVRATD